MLRLDSFCPDADQYREVALAEVIRRVGANATALDLNFPQRRLSLLIKVHLDLTIFGPLG